MSRIIDNIWMIDDSSIDLFLQTELMRKQGIGTEFSRFFAVDDSLKELQERIENSTALPDLILLDIQMPGKNGFDFMTHYTDIIASIENKPLLYVLSSSIIEEDLKRMMQHPLVDGMLRKPLDVKELTNALNSK